MEREKKTYTQEVVDELALDLNVIGVDVPQELVELFVADTVVEVHDPVLLLGEVVSEQCFEVSGSGSQDDLVCIDLLPFDHQSHVGELLLVQEVNEVTLLGSVVGPEFTDVGVGALHSCILWNTKTVGLLVCVRTLGINSSVQILT